MRSRRHIVGSLVFTLALTGGLIFAIATQHVRGIDVTSRLVSFDRNAEMGGDSCSWEAASMLEAPLVGLQAKASSARFAAGEPAPDPTRQAAVASAKPVRFIQDPYPGFLALTVDTVRDEIVAMDGNRFNFLVYDRTVATPATAEFTKPKRQFRAPETAWYMSDVHVDGKTGDIYAVNNDSMRGMNVFRANNQSGHVKANQHLNIPYGTYGLAVDDERGEAFFSIQHDSAIVVWPRTAKDGDLPIRLIQGDKTHMGDPHHVYLDKKNSLLWVVNYGTSRNSVAGTLGSAESKERPRIPNWPSGNLFIQPAAERPGYRFEIVLGTGKFGMPSITAFPELGQGNISPVREIVGPKTGLSWPTGIARDEATGEIWVANAIGDTVSVFAADASGDVAPIRVISGPKAMLKNPSSVAIDNEHGEAWVANYGSHTAVAFKLSAKGDTAPVRVIRSAPLTATRPVISNPFAAAYDSRRGDIIVPNCVSHPRISVWDPMADKTALPKRAIEGQKTHLNRTVHSIAYDEVNDEIVVQSNIGQAILFFRGNATGDEAPVRVIQGPSTKLRDPEKISIYGVHNEVFAYNMTIYNEILVFDSKVNGDAAPKRILSGGYRYRFGNMFVDTTRDLLIVSGAERGQGGGPRLFIFDRKASGNAEPLRKINAPGGAIRVVPKTGKIAVTVGGGDDSDAAAVVDETGERHSNAHVAIYDVNDSGAVKPEWTVGRGKLLDIRGLALDTRNKTVIISDKGLQGVLTFSLPEIF